MLPTPPEALLSRLGLGRFAALDLETTGLEDTCEIIELGLVIFEGGQARTTVSTLVQPTQPVPPRILQLTGIDPRKLKKAPRLAEILPEALAALGNAPVVAHNLAFDQGVLMRQSARVGLPWRPAHPGFDTVPIARMLLPTCESHRLADVAAFLGISLENAHRATDDARAAGELLLRLTGLGAGLDVALLRRLMVLAHGTGDVLEAYVQGLLEWVKEQGENGTWRSAMPVGRSGRYQSPGTEIGPDFAAAAWFGEGGRLHQAVEGFRHRPQQEEMAGAVGEWLKAPPLEEAPRLLVAEAATGTGKSFAYLVPALLWSAQRREEGAGPVVVSTHTRHLQEQLFHHDLPRLGPHLGRPLRAALLKGRGNYLCGHRLENVLAEAQERLSPADRLALMPLVTWAAITRSGDVEESTGFRAAHLGRLWSQVRSEGPTCANPRCRVGDTGTTGVRCWGAHARQAAQSAHLLVVNHSLLLSDAGAAHGILGPFDTLIVDEAHQFGRSADQQLRRSFSFQHVENRLRGLHDPAAQGRGGLRQLRKAWTAAVQDMALADRGLRALEEVAEAVDLSLQFVMDARAGLSTVQKERHGESLQRNRYTHKERLRGENSPLRLLHQPCAAVVDGVGSLLRAMAALEKVLDEAKEEALQAQLGELRGIADSLREDLDLLVLLLDEDDEDGAAVIWCEIHPVSVESIFHRLPLEAGRHLAEELWKPLKRVLFTSATLAVADSFDWISDRLGLGLCEGELRCLKVDSPFNLPRQARVLVPTFLPEASGYQTEAFAGELARLLSDTSERHGRGTLVLFTSYTLLNRCHHALLKVLDQKRFPLLAQGLDGSRGELLERFRNHGKAILLGVDSFWEGVDLPGEALQILVMTKLPFDVPGEPLLDARSDLIQRQGGNAFRDMSVPEAVIRFRQGFGRLIRHEGDKGVFLLLDKRAVMKEYGRRFLDSLPLAHQMVLREEDLHRELRSFFA